MGHWTENAASYEKTLRQESLWDICKQLDPEFKQVLRLAFKGDEFGLARYQDVILGIERRWDAVMKRRNNN